jgi:hypothetical protein
MKPPKSSPPIISSETESGSAVEKSIARGRSRRCDFHPAYCRTADKRRVRAPWPGGRGKRLLDMSPEELDAVFDAAVESVDDLYPPVQTEGPPPWQGEG